MYRHDTYTYMTFSHGPDDVDMNMSFLDQIFVSYSSILQMICQNMTMGVTFEKDFKRSENKKTQTNKKTKTKTEIGYICSLYF